jgi:phytoene dehydrogenase-like protein
VTDTTDNYYDSIIIGAGHNGLVCAAYLAKSNQRIIVVEAADELGGMAASREFHPGFKTSLAHSLKHFSTKIVKDLNLRSQGFELGAKATPPPDL